MRASAEDLCNGFGKLWPGSPILLEKDPNITGEERHALSVSDVLMRPKERQL